MVINWSKWGLLTGPSWGPKKKANLDQLITTKISARIFCIKNLKPFFIVFLTNKVLKKTNMDQLITIKNPQTWTS